MDDLLRSDPDRDDATGERLAQHTYDWSVTSPVVAVAETMSSVSGDRDGDPGPVQDVVDGDALEALLRTDHDSPVAVSFVYGDYVVTVTSDGDLSFHAA